MTKNDEAIIETAVEWAILRWCKQLDSPETLAHFAALRAVELCRQIPQGVRE